MVKGDLVLIKIRFHAARTGCEQDFPEASRTQSVGMSARMGEGGVVVGGGLLRSFGLGEFEAERGKKNPNKLKKKNETTQ